MSNYKFTFRIEMNVGQDIRMVDADSYDVQEDWMIFYRSAPQGGRQEYWRVRTACVVSIEVKKP